MKSPMVFLQPLGRALMLPIAVLPVAGLLLRLGQDDISTLVGFNLSFLSAAGGAIFDNLGLLFAVGVATGFARDGNGAAALAGIVCYLVSVKGAETLLTPPPDVGAGLAKEVATTVAAAWRSSAIHKFDVPLGILAGLIGGSFYNRFAGISLPNYLAFFGGRRFVPIVSGLMGLAIAAALGAAYTPLSAGVDALSNGVVAAGGWGLFAFGVLNRLLIVTGLHHILNNVAYFVVGDYHGTTGDLRRFFAGDPTAGVFMSGFFPVMMFGLPAACLAMYHEALPARRKAVGGLFLSLALTSLLTGVTEPIEFTFMFLAPVLYVIHAILTGAAEVLMNLLGVRLGYGFSAGLFDYLLNYTKATRPLLLLPVGAIYAAIYYVIFRVVIRRWNLQTPGREPAEDTSPTIVATGVGARGAAFVAALGGAANLREVGACTTRLRLIVADQGAVDEPALRRLGAMGVLKPSAEAVQVVVGPIADSLAVEMQAAMGTARQPSPAVPMSATVPVAAPATLPPVFVAALGGAENIVSVTHHHGRWRVTLRRPIALPDDLAARGGVRAVIAPPGPDATHVVHILT